MPRTISGLKTDLGAILHGTNLDHVTASTDLFNRAARDILLDIDPPETKRRSQVTLYEDVYDYAVPNDLKANKILDIRPQTDRQIKENWTQVYSEEFDLYKTDWTFQVAYNAGVKTLRAAIDTGNSITLHNMETIAGNGTWAVADDGTNLTRDTLTFAEGGASLNFDSDGLGVTATITNSTFTDVDLTDHDERSSIFMWVFLPDASAITNVISRWGNDAANYWTRTITAPHTFTAFQDGWNLLRFDWNGATEVGTVAPAAIDYLLVTITYDGNAETDYRVDNIVSRLGDIHNVVYYSRFMFQNAAGTFIEETTADTDLCNLEQGAVNLLLYRTAELAAQQIQAEDAGFDVSYFSTQYQRYLTEYKHQFKSEVEKPRASYYRMPNISGRRSASNQIG